MGSKGGQIRAYTKDTKAKKCQIMFLLHKARLMSVYLGNEHNAKADLFVNDIISVVVDTRDNLERLEVAPCTVMDAMAHKVK